MFTLCKIYKNKHCDEHEHHSNTLSGSIYLNTNGEKLRERRRGREKRERKTEREGKNNSVSSFDCNETDSDASNTHIRWEK